MVEEFSIIVNLLVQVELCNHKHPWGRCKKETEELVMEPHEGTQASHCIMVHALISGLSYWGLSPGRGYYLLFLGDTTLLSQTGKLNTGVAFWRTTIPSRGYRNTHSHFVLLEIRISSGLMGHLVVCRLELHPITLNTLCSEILHEVSVSKQLVQTMAKFGSCHLLQGSLQAIQGLIQEEVAARQTLWFIT